MIKIDIFSQSSSSFRKQYTLENEIFYITIFWNSRSASWFLKIEDETESTILAGVKIVPGLFLLKKFALSSTPKGDFKCAKETTSNTENGITYENLGQTYNLYYFNSDEI